MEKRLNKLYKILEMLLDLQSENPSYNPNDYYRPTIDFIRADIENLNWRIKQS